MLTTSSGDSLINSFTSVIYKLMNVHNKLEECLSLVRFSSLLDKHSDLLQKLVNHGQKSFITLGPGDNLIKNFICNLCKLECLSLASLSSIIKCLWIRPGASTGVKHLKGMLSPYSQTLN
jgi:hypothetical protein